MKGRNFKPVTIFLTPSDLVHYAKYFKGIKNTKVSQWNFRSFQVLPIKIIRLNSVNVCLGFKCSERFPKLVAKVMVEMGRDGQREGGEEGREERKETVEVKIAALELSDAGVPMPAPPLAGEAPLAAQASFSGVKWR